jgi:hypothetical protein
MLKTVKVLKEQFKVVKESAMTLQEQLGQVQ